MGSFVVVVISYVVYRFPDTKHFRVNAAKINPCGTMKSAIVSGDRVSTLTMAGCAIEDTDDHGSR